MTRYIAMILILCGTTLLGPKVSLAITVDVEPDNFPSGTNITSAFPGITLSVEGQPGGVVLAVDGYSAFNGRNIATTGTLLFGQFPSPNGIGWVEGGGGVDLLRADFSSPADFVQIDLIFDDDDIAGLWAYDSSGILLGYVEGRGDGRGPVPFVRARISRPTADIAYILAGGVNGETSELDNLHVRIAAVPEPSTLALAALGALGLLIAARRNR